MSTINSLDAYLRQDMGKGASHRLRRQADKVPGIVYGIGKPATAIAIEQRLIRKALEDEGFYSRIVTLNIDGVKEKVVLKDVQRHPHKAQILHMDFLRVSATEKIHMHVPIHFIGEHDAPGLKEGGVISKEIIETEVSCLPGDLPEFLELDVSQMQMDESRHLSDVKVPNGVELLILSKDDGNDPPVASLHRPKVVVEEEPTTDDAEAASDEPATDGEQSDDGKQQGSKDSDQDK